MYAPFNHRYTSSGRTDLAAHIMAVTIPGPIHVGTESKTAVSSTTHITSAVVSVPMGILSPDRRAAGDWYISVAGPEAGVASYTLVAELVESPVISQFIPLDAEQAEQEKCGRFCVVLTGAAVDDGKDEVSAAPPPRLARLALSLPLLTALAAMVLVLTPRR